MMEAPLSSSRSTTQAEREGTGRAHSQSGFPAPVGQPATSIKSLTAKVRPASAPADFPATVHRGPGTKAFRSVHRARSQNWLPDDLPRGWGRNDSPFRGDALTSGANAADRDGQRLAEGVSSECERHRGADQGKHARQHEGEEKLPVI